MHNVHMRTNVFEFFNTTSIQEEREKDREKENKSQQITVLSGIIKLDNIRRYSCYHHGEILGT